MLKRLSWKVCYHKFCRVRGTDYRIDIGGDGSPLDPHEAEAAFIVAISEIKQGKKRAGDRYLTTTSDRVTIVVTITHHHRIKRFKRR